MTWLESERARAILPLWKVENESVFNGNEIGVAQFTARRNEVEFTKIEESRVVMLCSETCMTPRETSYKITRIEHARRNSAGLKYDWP